jgi:hypothetical protein
MDLAIALGITLIIGIILGWLAASHIHSLTSAATRAVPAVPGVDIAALTAKVAGLGTQLQKSTAVLASHITTVGTAAAPTPAVAATVAAVVVPPVPPVA